MLSVGQKLWFVPKHGSGKEIEVTKVGRKWAQASGVRQGVKIDVETLYAVDGGYSCGRCHLDREKYETEQARQVEWLDLYQRINSSPPSHLTLEDIREIRAKLRL